MRLPVPGRETQNKNNQLFLSPSKKGEQSVSSHWIVESGRWDFLLYGFLWIGKDAEREKGLLPLWWASWWCLEEEKPLLCHVAMTPEAGSEQRRCLRWVPRSSCAFPCCLGAVTLTASSPSSPRAGTLRALEKPWPMTCPPSVSPRSSTSAT